MCNEWTSGNALAWWTNPLGKYNKSPAYNVTSNTGSPISSCVKLSVFIKVLKHFNTSWLLKKLW